MMQNYHVRCVHVPAAGKNTSKQHGLSGQRALESRQVSKKSLCHQSSKPPKGSVRNSSQNQVFVLVTVPALPREGSSWGKAGLLPAPEENQGRSFQRKPTAAVLGETGPPSKGSLNLGG